MRIFNKSAEVIHRFVYGVQLGMTSYPLPLEPVKNCLNDMGSFDH